MNTKLTIVALAAAVVSSNALNCMKGTATTSNGVAVPGDAPVTDVCLAGSSCISVTEIETNAGESAGVTSYGCVDPTSTLAEKYAAVKCTTTGTTTITYNCGCLCTTDDCNTVACTSGAAKTAGGAVAAAMAVFAAVFLN